MTRASTIFCAIALLTSASGQLLAETIRYSNTFPSTPFQAVNGDKWTTYTFAGPNLATGILLPYGVKEMATSTNGFNVGINDSYVWSVDLANQTAQEIGDSATPEIEWITGITFDSLRNHFYLSTLSGEGFIYSYDYIDNKWSVLNSLNQVDTTAIVYSSAFDRIFAIASGAATPLSLKEYDPVTGVLIRSRPIELALPGTQLIVVDNYLVLVSGPIIQAIDPVTVETWLVLPVPELSSTVLTGVAMLCLCVVTFLARRRVLHRA